MIAYINSTTKTLAIPEHATLDQRSKFHRVTKQRYGVYDTVRYNPAVQCVYDLILIEFQVGKVLVMETAAIPKEWSTTELADVVRSAQMLPMAQKYPNALQILDV